jgi:hypothetical protein
VPCIRSGWHSFWLRGSDVERVDSGGHRTRRCRAGTVGAIIEQVTPRAQIVLMIVSPHLFVTESSGGLIGTSRAEFLTGEIHFTLMTPAGPAWRRGQQND